MDAVPDMDDLLDQLEAFEEASQSSFCDRPFTKPNNENDILQRSKDRAVCATSIPPHISTISADKLGGRETVNADSGQQLSRLKDLSNISEPGLVQEANLEDAQSVSSHTRKDRSESNVNKSADQPAATEMGVGSDFPSSEAKVSGADIEGCVAGNTMAVEEVSSSVMPLTTNVCNIPETEPSPATVMKENLPDRFMRISLQPFNKVESNFEKSCEQVTNELNQMAREFEEMDEYLARYDLICSYRADIIHRQNKDGVILSEISWNYITDTFLEGRCVVENAQPKVSEMGTEEIEGEMLPPMVESRAVVAGSDDAHCLVKAADDAVASESMEVANERCDASNVPDTTDSAQIAPEGASGLEEIAAEKEIAVLQGDDRADEKGEESGTVAQLATDAKVTEQSFDVVQGKQLSNVTVDDVSAAAVLLTDNEAIAQSGQSKEAADGAEGTDERHAVGGEQIGVVVAGDEHRLTDLTMEGGALEETNEEGAHSTAKTEVTKRDDAQKEEQGEEAHEEAGMKEWTEDTIEGEADIGENVEETRGVSVVASTHDISSETDLTRLTESELQLGKVKPVWIADSETASCMLCCAKFTLILRRHHCRSCGRVLCGQCTAYKAVLPYMNDSSKKFKVCEPCLQTLQRIDDYEKGIGLQEDSTDASTNEPGASSSALSADIPRMTKSVLKVKSSEASNEAAEGGERPSGTGDVAKRSVTFRDGVNPGDGTADKGVTDAAIAPEPSNLIPKPKKKRASVVRRVKELRMEEENVCLLPKEADDPLYTRRANGAVEKLENLEEVQRRLADEEIVVIAVSRNLCCNIKICKCKWMTFLLFVVVVVYFFPSLMGYVLVDCCGLGRVMCVSSSGMFAVGLDEIMIVYDLDEDEQPSLPVNIIHRIHEIYECSLKPQNESFDEKMGIRAVHLRVPPLHSTLRKNEQDDFAGRDILLFRPSLQCFDNLVLPSWPFLVACFVQQCEKLWAMAIPNRLLYRIGLQASYYPTPIVNRRGREPVYTPVTDTTVLKVFIDFRNWSYRMLMVHGSTLELQDNGSRLVVPTWAKGELRKLVESNRNMIAFALDFNAAADSHLVCEQDEAGSYRTQVFTTGVTARKITGASFIIVDGALKSADVPLTVNVVEDGIAIRLRADAMKAFAEAISAGEDYVLESSAMKFSLEWRNTPLRADSLGQLVSPVDQSSLMVTFFYLLLVIKGTNAGWLSSGSNYCVKGNYEYGLIESRILSSLYSIPSVNEWALRLVAVYNMANGKFAPLIQSKVFAVSEQIAAQIAYTLVPIFARIPFGFVSHVFITNSVDVKTRKEIHGWVFREISLRIRVTSDDAGYVAAKWANMEQEHSTWRDLLDNQLVPGLFNICSFIPSGFEAELSMALVSTRPLP
ncbi:unnamed protein product [Toxocara canis]|uniref:FYVE-type domain-containing protein n=1 Tax=Toxocara canis TaxID=6265 RepID=A0A183UH45_TOXCA|nr:unnamed protein product [Toxocara canis]